MIWVLIGALTLGTLVFKATGPVLTGGVEPPAPLARVIAMLTPALLTSLVVISTFASESHLRLDARAAGLVVGGLLLVIRAPLWVALVAGAGSAALIRALASVG